MPPRAFRLRGEAGHGAGTCGNKGRAYESETEPSIGFSKSERKGKETANTPFLHRVVRCFHLVGAAADSAVATAAGVTVAAPRNSWPAPRPGWLVPVSVRVPDEEATPVIGGAFICGRGGGGPSALSSWRLRTLDAEPGERPPHHWFAPVWIRWPSSASTFDLERRNASCLVDPWLPWCSIFLALFSSIASRIWHSRIGKLLIALHCPLATHLGPLVGLTFPFDCGRFAWRGRLS